MLPLASERQAAFLTGELLKQGVIIRPLKAFGLPACVRISSGTDEETQILVDAVRQVCAKESLCNS
jgi:histidinol-phosphate aminotransferase